MSPYDHMLEWLRWRPVEWRVHRYQPWQYDKSIPAPVPVRVPGIRPPKKASPPKMTTPTPTTSPFGSTSADVLIGHLRACKTEEEIAEFAGTHGLDMALWYNAPNKGVGKMRLINALRNRK